MSDDVTLVKFEDADHNDTVALIELGRQYEQANDELEAEIRALKKKLEVVPWWQTLADAVNAWRVFPRLALTFFMWMSYETIQYALAQPPGSYADAGVAGLTVTALSGALAAYMASGSKKGA